MNRSGVSQRYIEALAGAAEERGVLDEIQAEGLIDNAARIGALLKASFRRPVLSRHVFAIWSRPLLNVRFFATSLFFGQLCRNGPCKTPPFNWYPY